MEIASPFASPFPLKFPLKFPSRQLSTLSTGKRRKLPPVARSMLTLLKVSALNGNRTSLLTGLIYLSRFSCAGSRAVSYDKGAVRYAHRPANIDQHHECNRRFHGYKLQVPDKGASHDVGLGC